MPSSPSPPSSSPPRIVLVGAPGAGKGTQGPVLAERLGVVYLATGDVLRSEVACDSGLGRRVAVYLDGGELVPDDLIVDVVVDRLAPDAGYVLDGFPRTVAQADTAEQRVPGGLTHAVVFLTLPDDVARGRLAQRDQGRSDDADPSTIEHRLRVFHAETEPLLDWYRARGVLHAVDATHPPEAVLAAIESALAIRA